MIVKSPIVFQSVLRNAELPDYRKLIIFPGICAILKSDYSTAVNTYSNRCAQDKKTLIIPPR